MTKTNTHQGRHTASHSLAGGFIATHVASFQERLAARKAMRTFRRELDTYATPSQIDDLLAMISTQDDADSQALRRVLVSNLHHRS